MKHKEDRGTKLPCFGLRSAQLFHRIRFKNVNQDFREIDLRFLKTFKTLYVRCTDDSSCHGLFLIRYLDLLIPNWKKCKTNFYYQLRLLNVEFDFVFLNMAGGRLSIPPHAALKNEQKKTDCMVRWKPRCTKAGKS